MDDLSWNEESRTKIIDAKIFSLYESSCRSPHDDVRLFTILDAPDWAIIIPVLETPHGQKFIMVRQWRHGSRSMSLEFPGGVFEPGENPQAAAARELLEETGYQARSIQKIGEFNPNPAIMTNTTHFFLAQDLVNTGSQRLDPDEYVHVELVSTEEVCRGMGKPPFIHALMGSALALYTQTRG